MVLLLLESKKKKHRDGTTEALSPLLISEGWIRNDEKERTGGCFCGDLGQVHGVAEGRNRKD